MDYNINITEKQKQFIDAVQDEVLYGGAAGGGKSYGQVVDAFLSAVKHPGIKQLILRTSFPELERSLIMTALEIIPAPLYKYNSSKHRLVFTNGSVIEFGYLTCDSDVTQYQSAEYDIIRFDELTHFSEYQYTYMLSRIRGINSFPKQVKSSTNPGSAGHNWVKERFIHPSPPGQEYTDGAGRTRIFISARVQENPFLMNSDPDYIKRLKALPDKEKKALLYGDWDIFEGQYFPEFSREKHIVRGITPPSYHKKFRSLDYGLDMTACYWWAVDSEGVCTLYREFYKKGLTLSEAAREIVALTPENESIAYTAASPDLWNRRQDTGKSGMEIMAEQGLVGLVRADNRRVEGWRVLREYLKEGRLKICDHCVNIIRTLPALTHDRSRPEDAADSPHEITHAPEAVRYGIMSRPPVTIVKPRLTGRYTPGEMEDLSIKDNKRIVKRR